MVTLVFEVEAVVNCFDQCGSVMARCHGLIVVQSVDA